MFRHTILLFQNTYIKMILAYSKTASYKVTKNQSFMLLP